MIWYRALDYIRTRNGQVLALTGVLATLFVVVARLPKLREVAEVGKEARLQQLSPDEFWDEHSPDSQATNKEDFEIREINSSSRVFRVPPPRPAVHRQPEEPAMTTEPIASQFVPRSPLIVFERSREITEEKDDVAVTKKDSGSPVQLEPGRLLYCQTVGPVSSGARECSSDPSLDPIPCGEWPCRPAQRNDPVGAG